ncbi:MAG: hypothetical protein WCP21_05215 [Armatimonadota bacterium]
MTNPKPEPTITSDDLQEKWQEVQEAVRDQVEQKVLGMSYLTAGLVVVGVGALGTAYYLGRHSAAGQGREAVAEATPPQLPRPAPARPSTALDPLLDQALRSAVTALMDRLKPPPQ